MSKINTTNLFPYNKIVETSDTILGNCVRIPKIFVKNSVTESGLITRMISNEKIEDYHCHPAFMQDGHERNAILIKKELDAFETQITFDEAKTAETNFKNNYGADYHMYNIYEHHLIGLLMLIEYGTTDLQNAMGGSDTAETADWYGLTQHWGDIDLWIDGIDTKGTSGAVRIFDNLGNFTLQDTDYLTGADMYGYPLKLATNSGEHYDFKDIFIGASQWYIHDFNQGSFGDYQDFARGNNNIQISAKGWEQDNGAFLLIEGQTTAAYRMAKFSN